MYQLPQHYSYVAQSRLLAGVAGVLDDHLASAVQLLDLAVIPSVVWLAVPLTRLRLHLELRVLAQNRSEVGMRDSEWCFDGVRCGKFVENLPA